MHCALHYTNQYIVCIFWLALPCRRMHAHIETFTEIMNAHA